MTEELNKYQRNYLKNRNDKFYTLIGMFRTVMDKGMELRQSQLKGEICPSENEILQDWIAENVNEIYDLFYKVRRYDIGDEVVTNKDLQIFNGEVWLPLLKEFKGKVVHIFKKEGVNHYRIKVENDDYLYDFTENDLNLAE